MSTGHAASSGHTLQIGVHPQWVWHGYSFNADTLISAWMVSAFLIILALVMSRILNKKPGKLQTVIELGLESLMDTMKDKLGDKAVKYFPLIATFFIFILSCNWIGILPFELKPPTADLNTTVGLALLAIISVQIIGMIEKGPIRYFKRFFEPNPAFFPLNVIEECAKPLSLSIRLFGNIFSKETVIMILISLVAFPIIFPIPILALSLLVGAIQAYIFTLLTIFYISMAIEGH